MTHETNSPGPPAILAPPGVPPEAQGRYGHGDNGGNGGNPSGAPGQGRDWRKLRDAGVATVAWLAIIGAVFWALAHVIGALLIFILAAILAYALSPAVKHLERFMPRGVAIALVYVGILTTLSGLIYLIAITAVGQVSMLLRDLQSMLAPTSNGQVSPLVATLRAVGLSDTQIQTVANRMLQQVQNLTGDAVSVAAGVIDAVVSTVLVGVLSIYLIKDGPLVVQWLRNNTPISHRSRVVFGVETLDTVVGGYIRGQLTLSALIGLLVGGGMWAFHVPYAVFLGVLAFVLEFVPLVGVFVSGAICVILALTVGWLTAVFVLAYFVIVHFIEGDFIGPRIMSRAVGLHPAVSILALVAGAELFGVWGALFAAPVAGLVQAVLRALWLEWRVAHPEQFPTGYTVTPSVRIVPVTHLEAAPVGSVEPRAVPSATSVAPVGLLGFIPASDAHGRLLDLSPAHEGRDPPDNEPSSRSRNETRNETRIGIGSESGGGAQGAGEPQSLAQPGPLAAGVAADLPAGVVPDFAGPRARDHTTTTDPAPNPDPKPNADPAPNGAIDVAKDVAKDVSGSAASCELARALLPEVATWEPKRLTISFYEQFSVLVEAPSDEHATTENGADVSGTCALCADDNELSLTAHGATPQRSMPRSRTPHLSQASRQRKSRLDRGPNRRAKV